MHTADNQKRVQRSGDSHEADRWVIISAWLPVLTYMAAIHFLSSLRALPELPEYFISWDKAQHFLAYTGLGLLTCRASRLRPLVSRMWVNTQAFGIVALYGVVDEIHQIYVPGRSADVDDWVADAAGALFAVIIVVAVRKILTKGGEHLDRSARR